MPCPRLRFSLRTLFVAVTLLCLYLGWAMHWLRQRHEFLASFLISDSRMIFAVPPTYALREGKPPLMLRPFGEDGYSYFLMPFATATERDAGRRLFPEAEIDEFSFRSTAAE